MEHATLDRPDGDGPFPLVIQLHGCGGPRPFLQTYGATALAQGAAVLSVDSATPRGLAGWRSNALVCTGAVLRGAERAADLYALYDWARRQSWVDDRKIAAAGWSHGGWTIMDGLAAGPDAGQFCRLTDLPRLPLEGLAGTILIYPYAGPPSLTLGRGWGEHRPKVFAMLGGKDRVVGTRQPALALERLRGDGLEMDVLRLAEATHAFDDDQASDPRSRFRPDLRDQALDWYARAVATLLR